MGEPEELDHAVGVAGQAGIARAEQAREHRALVLLRGEDEVLAHGQFGKTCSSWNVRLTPSRLRSHGRMPVTARPSSRTSPALG